MTTPAAPPALPQSILYAAAEWYAVLHDEKCTAQEREKWQAWLRAADSHRLAWQQVEAIHQRFNGVDGRLAAPVLKRAGTERRQLLKLVALAGLTGAGGYLLPWESYAADYRTAVGEKRVLTLSDGSQLWMNTDSAVNLTLQNHRLQLQLIQGEIALTTQTRQTLALVTPQGMAMLEPCECSLRLDDGLSCISVYRGELWVIPKRWKTQGQRISARQQVSFSQREVGETRIAQDYRQSWKSGQLVVDNMPLPQFVAELNRYRKGYLTLADSAASLSISGVFPLNQPELILDSLTRVLPVSLHARFPGWIEIRAVR